MTHELAHIERTDEGLRELALFAGAGGGILGGHLLGWRCVCAVVVLAWKTLQERIQVLGTKTRKD